jgi:hypothetical protein
MFGPSGRRVKMKRSVILIIAAVAPILAASASGQCEPPHNPQIHTVWVRANITTNPDSVTIDKTRHDDPPQLCPGDRLQWALDCNGTCPAGVKLDVDVGAIQPLAIFDLLDPPERARVLREARAGRQVTPNYGDKKPQADHFRPGVPFHWADPTAVNNVLISGPYRRFHYDLLWKFTWEVSLHGVSDNWDPHFRGHRSR